MGFAWSIMVCEAALSALLLFNLVELRFRLHDADCALLWEMAASGSVLFYGPQDALIPLTCSIGANINRLESSGP